MGRRKIIRVQILGREWRVSLLEGDAFVRAYGKEDAGITLPDSMEIVFHADELLLPTIRHELFHAAYAACCVTSASLKMEQQEEVFADIFAHHSPYLVKLANWLFQELKDDAA